MRIIFLVTVVLIVQVKSFGQDGTKSLRIGDKCPDFEISMQNYSKPILKLSELAGKSVLLDFWATWCAPCVASFPKMDSIEKVFNGKLFILPITYEDSGTVRLFFERMQLARRGLRLTGIKDKILNQVFPHSTIPHYVWLDSNRIIRATTLPEYVTIPNLTNLVNGKKLNLPVRDDFEMNNKSSNTLYPLLQEIRKDTNILSYNILAKMIPDQPGSGSWDQNSVYLSNLSILGLFEIAFGEGMKLMGGWSHVKLITMDSTKFCDNSGEGAHSQQYRLQWRLISGHEYTYALKVPIGDSGKLFEFMRNDLKVKFPNIDASLKNIDRDCLVLRRIKNTNIIGSKEFGESDIKRSPFFLKINNMPFNTLILALKLGYQHSIFQIIDETKYSGKFDFEYYGDVADYVSVNKALSKYGLQLTKEQRKIQILEIKEL